MNINRYFDLTDSDLDNLLMGIKLKPTKITNNITKCINCNSKELINNNIKNQIICSNCGVVNVESFDENPDISMNENETTARYSTPSSYFYPQSSLGTKILGNSKLSILQRQGQMPYKEKSLMEVLEKIQYKCKTYGITQTIIDSAKILYKKITETVNIKGKRQGKIIIMRCTNRRSIIAACLFYACKLQNETRSPKEIADIYELPIKYINRGCRKFCDLIDINTLFNQINSSQPSDFIRYANILNLSKHIMNTIYDVTINIHNLNIVSSHEPPSIAAGSIYFVIQYYKLPFTKNQISEIFPKNISLVTISKIYRRIHPYQKIILNNNISNLIVNQYDKIYKLLNFNLE